MKLDQGPTTSELEIKKLCYSTLIDLDRDLAGVDLLTRMEYHIESMAWMLTNQLRLPVKVLQDNRVIASYPDGLWQHIRKTLGLKYRKWEAKLTEWLVFPQYKLPPGIDKLRVAVMPRLDCIDWTNGEKVYE